MGTVRVIHSYAAIVFTLAVVSRLVWMFVGRGHAGWREFIPVERDRRAGFGPMLAFYLFARRKPLPVVGHNPLAAAAYVFVFLLYVVMIATGLGMYATDAVAGSPVAWAKVLLPIFSGAEGARWIHHVTMWLLLGFVVHHLYSAVLTSAVERNGTMESIFTGSKWLPRELVEHDKDSK
jgi:Ni/Fe-hydrogenase 1 B-type cytochrome subunit